MLPCLVLGLVAILFAFPSRSVDVDERYNDAGLWTFVTVRTR